jgi:carnitine O-acetyltransferase
LDTDGTPDGFFDAGMLLQALKARGRGSKYDSSETKASERAAVQAKRRDVGKKLRLSEV